MENYNFNFPSSSSFHLPDSSNISHSDQNPAPATTTTLPPPTDQTPQFSSDQSSCFPSYCSTDGTLEHLVGMTTNAIPQDQPMRFESNALCSAGQPKTHAEIACENYLREYSVMPNGYADRSSIIEGVGELSRKAPGFDPTIILKNFGNNPMANGNVLSARLPSTAPAHIGHYPVGCVNYSINNLPLAAASLPSPPLPSRPPNNGAVDCATHGAANSLRKKNTFWSRSQHELFLVGMKIFGKGNWKKIANKVMITKSHKQVASHAQKFFIRQGLPKEKRKRPSIYDNATVNPLLLMQVRARLGRPPPVLPDQTPQCPPSFDNNNDVEKPFFSL